MEINQRTGHADDRSGPRPTEWRLKMSMLHYSPTPFTVTCYQNGAFHELNREDLLGHWSVLFFYPADFTFVCPTELADLAPGRTPQARLPGSAIP